MMIFRGANADTSGNLPPASALAAKVEDAWAARALGEDRVVEFGRYRLLRIIGRGGMGQVFEAWDPQLERHVAIKLVLRGGARATLEEARCLARVAHPNVVSVHDVGRVGELVYIAMELVDGPDLRGWLRAERRRWTEILEVVLAVGRGLAAVHDAGLLHGDVKPGNVLIGRDGRVRVADFGLARAGTHVGEACNPELDELVRGALEAVDRELGDEPEMELSADRWHADSLPPEDGLSSRPGDRAELSSRPGDRAELSSRPGDRAELSSRPGDRAELSSRRAESLDAFAIDELRCLLGELRPRPGGSPRAHAGGTVPYMAPERRSGNAGGPAADQYSFCATAWEALCAGQASGKNACPSAVAAVLRQGMAERPEARLPSMDAVCSALEQARDRPARMASRTRNVVLVGALTFGVAVGAAGLTDDDAVADCERMGQGVWAQWGPEQRAALRLRFASSTLPRSEGHFVVDRLDAWIEDWSALWPRACVAEPGVRECLAHERERFEAVLSLLDSRASDGGPASLAAGRALVTELGSPTVCLDANRDPSLSVAGIGRLAELSAIERRIELAVLAGAHERASDELRAFDAELAELAAEAEPSELELRRLAAEPLRARVLAANGQGGLARMRLRTAIREVEARGHDGLRFALLLEQTRITARLTAESGEEAADLGLGFGWAEPPLGVDDPVLGEPPTVDDLAALDGLAERVDAGPVARAELGLLRAGLTGGNLEQLTAELEAAGEALATHQPDGYAELRLELALRRAQLHFAARQLDEASRAAEQAWAIGKSLRERSGPRMVAALTIAGVSAALLGDCTRVGGTVERLWQLTKDPEVDLGARRDVLRGMSAAVDWVAVGHACANEGDDLRDLVLDVTGG
jgi:serine/threonine protein kinase